MRHRRLATILEPARCLLSLSYQRPQLEISAQDLADDDAGPGRGEGADDRRGDDDLVPVREARAVAFPARRQDEADEERQDTSGREPERGSDKHPESNPQAQPFHARCTPGPG